MKRILAPILLVVLLFPSLALGGEVTMKDLVKRDGLYYKKFTDVPFTGKVTSKYHQGKIRNGKKQGFWISYRNNGQLQSKGTYKDGKQDGLWFTYQANGTLYLKGVIKNGKREGLWVNYWHNGPLKYKKTFKNGVEDGPSVTYHPNGKLQSKGNYKNWEKDGVWLWYIVTGRKHPLFHGTFKNGIKVGE